MPLLTIFQRHGLLHAYGERLNSLEMAQEPAMPLEAAAGPLTERAPPGLGARQLEQIPSRGGRKLLDVFFTVLRSPEETGSVHSRLRSAVEPHEGRALPGTAGTEVVGHYHQLDEPRGPPHDDLDLP